VDLPGAAGDDGLRGEELVALRGRAGPSCVVHEEDLPHHEVDAPGHGEGLGGVHAERESAQDEGDEGEVALHEKSPYESIGIAAVRVGKR